MKADTGYFNRYLPIAGNLGVNQQATIGIGPVQTSIDLRALFGVGIDNGDGLLMKAVQMSGNASGAPGSWRANFSLSEKPQTITESLFTQGTASGGQCWPLTDGQEMLAHTTGGRLLNPTGYASGAAFTVLNVKTADPNMGTGLFKIMRHTLTETQDASRFGPPMPGYPSAIASGLVGLPSGYQARP